MTRHHGSSALEPLAPHSPLYQGPFGRLFPDLPSWGLPGADPGREPTDDEAQALLIDAVNAMVEVEGLSSAEVVAEGPNPQTAFDSEIPAGYTYFGQFVDHDITFDTASTLQRAADPNGLVNFRTPRLDLDNIYGRGPEDQPYMYDENQHGALLTDPAAVSGGSDFRDLPRNSQGRALIGDMRNDENAMVSQLQLAFLCAHNELLARAKADGASDETAFKQAQRTLRWLYQWVVWHDFLGRVCDRDVWEQALSLESDPCGSARWTLGYDHVYSWKHQPFMPIEFSVAAYRFGHTLVRNSYRPNASLGDTEVPIFAPGSPLGDLAGFRPIGASTLIQWDRYLDMESSHGDYPQRTHRIDAKLSNSLNHLDIEPDPNSLANRLAMRNLKRGWRFSLPSGTTVARALGVEPPEDYPVEADALWLYILNEADRDGGGQRLGKVGSILVAATFAGLLHGDRHSWIRQNPRWRPEDEPLLDAATDNRDGGQDDDGLPRWTLASIIRIAGVPVDDAAFGGL